MTENKDLEAATDMNTFLQRHAFDQMKRGISLTHILRDDQANDPIRTLAYFTTSVGQVTSVEIPKIVSARMTNPVFVLLRLAVDREYHRRGYGSKLFIHILAQMVGLASQTGIYALVLEPLNDYVRGFYGKFGLRNLPGDENRMFIRVRDVKSWLALQQR